jgi:hypothetical protein
LFDSRLNTWFKHISFFIRQIFLGEKELVVFRHSSKKLAALDAHQTYEKIITDVAAHLFLTIGILRQRELAVGNEEAHATRDQTRNEERNTDLQPVIDY